MRQHDPPTFFIDRDLGPTEDCAFIQRLRLAGMKVEAHNTHFPHLPAPDDHVWLGLCAERGWAAITHDKSIRFEPLPLAVIFESGVKLFVCIGTDSTPALAHNVAHTRHKIEAHVRKQRQPFITRIHMQRDEDKIRRRVAGDLRPWRDKQWYEAWVRGENAQ